MADRDIASVDALPGREWNAHAVAGDVLSRAEIDAPIIAVWMNKDGKLRYAKSRTDGATLSMFATLVLDMAQDCWRQVMRR